MSLPVHLVESLDGVAPGSLVEVTGDEAHHAVAVRRMRVGEALLLTDGRGALAGGAVEATRPVATRPEPSVSITLSPTRSRRTATAWCASSPVTSTVEPAAASTSDGTQWTGSVISAR